MKQIKLYLFPTMFYKWEVFAFFLKDLKHLNTESNMYFWGVHMAILIIVSCVFAPVCACLHVFVHI